MSTEPEVQPSTAALQFDRVVHADPSTASALSCALCNEAIAESYYHDGRTTLCAACGTARQRMATPDRSVRVLIRAGVYGAGAAILGALLYYGVMAFLELEIGIVAIAIGWLVGRAVAKATRGRSARRHQILALSLTYLSVALAYAPIAIKEWTSEAKADKAASIADSTAKLAPAAPIAPTASATAATGGAAAREGAADADAMTLGGFAVALLFVSGLLLALPLMAAIGSMPTGLLSILIIGLGLRQAWTISIASNAAVTGPHAIGGEAAA